MTAPSAASVVPVVRPPSTEELPRVLYLFRNLHVRAASRFLVAEKTHPLPRFVAAAAWWAEGATGRFQFACLPGVVPAEALPGLTEAVAAAACAAGLAELHYAELLPEGHGWQGMLQNLGFERVRSERYFETPVPSAWTRTNQLHEKHQAAIPAGWRTEPIRAHRPELILELIAPHRLLTPEEVRHCWHANAGSGFDPDLSSILFERERPFGTLLARLPADVLYVDVQVVTEPNPRLRSLGDLCLVYHIVRQIRPDGPMHWVRFRCGETEHRQTANLALRMGGREVGRVHALGKRLKP